MASAGIHVSRGLIGASLCLVLAPLPSFSDDAGHEHPPGDEDSGSDHHPDPTLLPVPSPRIRGSYELWLSDQANTGGLSVSTPDGLYGGKIRIYDSADLELTTPIDNPFVLDVVADLFPNADVTTQAHVSRIHGILASPDSHYMALNFVASGHLGIVDGRSKKSVCLFRTTRTDTGRQNHMSFWTPDGNHIIVANQNGKILERVDVVRNAAGAIRKFEFNADASLDFVGGTGRILSQPIAVDMDLANKIDCGVKGTVADNQSTTTPAGNPKQSPQRPNNIVICPIPTSTGKHAFATLGGGGMFVIDVRSNPMAIVAEYDMTKISAAGCGGIESQGYMHMNTGTSGPNKSEFSVYRFGIDYPDAPSFNLLNAPEPVAVWRDPDNGQVLPGNNRDAHGMLITGDELHVFDRVRNNVEIFPLKEPWSVMEPADEYDLTSTQKCGTTIGAVGTNDPTPDLGDVSLDGESIYVALRGPYPMSVAHAAVGSCPGLGIIRRDPSTQDWILAHVLPTTVMNYPQTKNLSDPHAVILRRRTPSEVPAPMSWFGSAVALTFARKLRRRIHSEQSSG